jgi:hypothetical protein
VRLSDEQIWARGHESENAVGNLVIHLAGNVSQWILGPLGGIQVQRDRDGEFEARGGIDNRELAHRLRAAVDKATAIIRNMDAEQLTRDYTIQNYNVSGLEVVYHVVEHFAQHTAQIIFATKMLTGDDLGFYRHLQSDSHSERVP